LRKPFKAGHSVILYAPIITFAGMAQKKLLRFTQIKSFSNVMEYPENMQGNWKDFFKNNNPIVLELACGKGEYTVGLSALYPDKNFIGVEIKGNRLWSGAKISLANKTINVAFLRTQIDKINQYFTINEVEEIWITFPDPHLRKSKARKRLTHPKFLRLYKQIIKPDGLIHLKTDSPDLYYFTKMVIGLYDLKIVTDYNNLYEEKDINADLKIKTHYESLDIAKSSTVFYLCFSLPKILNPSDDKLNDALPQVKHERLN
jgi:tRNA (guanine-N7-)-methyltransferase